MNLQKRLEDLERRAKNNRPAPPVDPGQLAADLAENWSAIDRGEFSGSEYHARSLLALRDALETTEQKR